MSEKIEITREQLREAWNKVFREKQIGGYGSIEFVEYELFGPKKPREWTMHLTPAGNLVNDPQAINGSWGLIRVREVLENGE